MSQGFTIDPASITVNGQRYVEATCDGNNVPLSAVLRAVFDMGRDAGGRESQAIATHLKDIARFREIVKEEQDKHAETRKVLADTNTLVRELTQKLADAQKKGRKK